MPALLKAQIPVKWAAVREELATQQGGGSKEISMDAYQSLCQAHGLQGTEDITLRRFLHRTGFFYYDEQLSENIILDQLWAIKGIYEIIAPHCVAEDKVGKVRKERLFRQWMDKGHSKQEADTFLRFMVSSEICFCLEQKDNDKIENPTFIFPQYLHGTSEVLDDWEEKGNLFYRYRPPFFHKGIVERFMVRLGRLSGKRAMWRNGIRLISPNDPKTRALIQFDREQNHVCFQTRGQQKAAFLAELLKTLNDLLDENSETKPSERVEHAVSLEGGEYVAKQALQDQLENEAKYVKSESGVKIPVAELAQHYQKVFDLKLEKDVLREANQRATHPTEEIMEKKEIKIFVSYSSEEEPLLKAFLKSVKPHLKKGDFSYALWTDHQIDLGDEWKQEILKALDQSDAAILFVSADFVDSDFIEEEELAHFLADHEKLMLPVLARDYDFEHFEDLSKKQFFKTKFRDYPELEYPDEKENKIMPFEYLVEPKKKAKIFSNAYAKKLAEFINKSVEKRFG